MVRHPTLLALAVSCVLIAAACYSPTLPLPPPLQEAITVSPPDADGWVLVTGEPEAMDDGEQAVIINRRTFYGWIVPVDESGFEVEVQAQAGDWLSIQRRDGDEMGQSIQVQVPAE